MATKDKLIKKITTDQYRISDGPITEDVYKGILKLRKPPFHLIFLLLTMIFVPLLTDGLEFIGSYIYSILGLISGVALTLYAMSAEGYYGIDEVETWEIVSLIDEAGGVNNLPDKVKSFMREKGENIYYSPEVEAIEYEIEANEPAASKEQLKKYLSEM